LKCDTFESDATSDSPCFDFRFTQYQYSHLETKFVPIEFDCYRPYSYLIENYSKGIKEGAEYERLVNIYGKCNIEIPDKGIFALLIGSILTPFYIFQTFSILLWMNDDYELYASLILLTSLVSITLELIDMRRNLKNLKEMVDYELNVTVKRINFQDETVFYNIPSNDLVPGDIMIVPESMKMP
jgi:cation-transporting P-type ATPase 13A2